MPVGEHRQQGRALELLSLRMEGWPDADENQTGLETARKEMKHAGSHRSVKPRGDLRDDVAPAQVRGEVERRCGAQPITFGCGRAELDPRRREIRLERIGSLIETWRATDV
jgi:hypothetical protein